MLITDRPIRRDPHTRSGQLLPIVAGVVIHYTEWPGATADRIRGYFDSLPETEPGRYGSAHYAIGLEGEVVRMIPESEVAWHAGPSSATKTWIEQKLGGKPNWRTIGIELCHPDESGAFLRATWRSAAVLTADILIRHGIPLPDRIFRHHDCTGKACPVWMVRHPADWAEFVQDVRARM